MQTIKFRAWDNVAFQMYYPGEEDNIVFALEDNGIAATDITQEEEEFQTLHHLEYMQFTGLHDRNGKEIYEGDIVQHVNPFWMHAQYQIMKVVWEKVRTQEAFIKSGWEFKAIHHKGGTTKYIPENDFEVIGNIHETPELLKEETK